MFGWRKRIGYIGPTVMEVVPYEFYRFAPDGVGLVGVTCSVEDWSSDPFEKGLSQITSAATYLGARAVDFIIHGGGPMTAARGKDYEDNIVRQVEAAAKVPATTGLRAAMEALRHIGARRIAVASPYPDLHNQALVAYLKLHDFEPVWIEGMNIPFKRLSRIPPADIRRFAGAMIARAPRCDALYLPCPQWQAGQIVDALERDSGLPTVAHSHAVFFAAFKALAIKDPIQGHGKLLASLREPAR
jgi:maleate cis-trans isomerase